MKAVVVEEPGDIEQLKIRELPDPVPGKGEVLIETAYAACNWMDTQKRRGVYPDPSLTYPLILGNEASGRITSLGDGVTDFAVGDRVAAIMPSGGYAEKCVTSDKLVIPLPDEIPDKLAAAMPIVSLTAYHLLHTASRTKAGDIVLIHAIGGGVGLMTTQTAVSMGASVIGTVSSNGKGDLAKEYGASLIINRSKEDFVEAALNFSNDQGVDLVIDSLGGKTGMKSFDALRYYGRLINIGEAENWPDMNLRDKLYERSTSFAGFETIHALNNHHSWQAGIDFVVSKFAKNELQLPVVGEFPLERCQDMHRKIESRTVSGKLVLKTQ